MACVYITWCTWLWMGNDLLPYHEYETEVTIGKALKCEFDILIDILHALINLMQCHAHAMSLHNEQLFDLPNRKLKVIMVSFTFGWASQRTIRTFQ